MKPETRLPVTRLMAGFEAMLIRFRRSMSDKEYVNHKWLLDEARTALEKEPGVNGKPS